MSEDVPPLLFIPPRLSVGVSPPEDLPRSYYLQQSVRRRGVLAEYPGVAAGVPLERLVDDRRVLLLGGVGSGKTTLLEAVCGRGREAVGQVADLSRTEWEEVLIETADSDGGRKDCRLLIDGLDLGERRSTDRLLRLLDQRPHCRYTVASRTPPEEKLPDFTVLQLLPWSLLMVERWGKGMEFVSRNLLMAAAFCREQTDLPLTPLYVKFLCDLVEKGLALPRDYPVLYGSFIRWLLERSRREQGIGRLLEINLQLDLLAGLAVEMGKRGVRSLGCDECLDALVAGLREVGLLADVAEEILSELGVCSGVLRYVGNGEIAFLCEGMRRFLQARGEQGTRVCSGAVERDGAEGRAGSVELFRAALGGDTVFRPTPFKQYPQDLFRNRLCEAARYAGVARHASAADRVRLQAQLLRQFWQAPYELLQQRALGALCWLQDHRLLRHFREGLRSRVAFIRVRSAEGLTHLGVGEGTAALVGALGDSYWRVRRQALEGLGGIGGRACWKRVAVGLEDVHWQVRAAAIEALGRLGVPEAVPLLSRSLRAGYRSSQHDAAELFTRLGWRDKSVFPRKAATDQDLILRVRLAEALWRVGGEGYTALEDMLREGEEEVRLAVASVLAREEGEEAQEVLSEGCVSPSTVVRYRAVMGMLYIPPVCGVGHQPDERCASEEQRLRLTALLEDPSWQVRGVAAVTLGSLGRAAWAEPVIELLEDRDHFVNTNAAVGLGLAGCEKGVDGLLAVVEDGERPETARAFAAQALGRLGRSEVRHVLGRLLKGSGILLRIKGAQGLGDVGDEGSVEHLLGLALEDEEPAVRDAAFAAAYRICERLGLEPEDRLRKLGGGRETVVADAVSLLERYI